MPVPIWAGRYIGLPFEERGRDRGGLDCWGLVRLALAEQAGLALPCLMHDYRGTADTRAIAALIRRELPFWRAVEDGREKLNDVIVLRLQGHPVHVGLVLGDGCMLHIERGIDSAIERYRGPRWQDRIFGFYRYEPFHDDTRDASSGRGIPG